MNNLISIIMPVYNSSKYLEESIESVLAQKYTNWELICIDDGSSDNSIEILKYYEHKYKNIEIYSQENSGPAQARKLGIGKSRGNYITCLDSDDTISDDYLEETLKQALSTEADVTMPVMVINWKGSNEHNFNLKNNLKFKQVLQPKNAFLRTFPWTVHGSNLYKASHMKKYALTDISNVNNFNADEYLTRYLLLFSNKVVVSRGKYYYRYNERSITKKFSTRQFSSLKVDKLLFKLALSENLSFDEISLVAEGLFEKRIYQKKLFLDNINKINSYEVKQISIDLRDVYEKKFIKFENTKKIKRYIFLKLNYKIILLLPILRTILKSI